MMRGFYTARTGMIAHQQRLDIISNNLANVNTVAYKSMRPSFKDLVYENLNRPEAQSTAMTGHGVKVNGVDTSMAQGRLEVTGRSYDVALTREGDFFMVETPEGTNLYTRAGNFYAVNEDDEYYLADSNGYRVLDADGEPIELEAQDGEILFDYTALGVWRFPDPYSLRKVGGNTYAATVASGDPELVEEPKMQQGYLEGSGVDVPQEMTSMIEASKAFSLNARMAMVADEVQQTVNSLR